MGINLMFCLSNWEEISGSPSCFSVKRVQPKFETRICQSIFYLKLHSQPDKMIIIEKTCSNNIPITCNEKSLSRISAVWIRLMRAFLVTLIMIFCKFYRKSENLTQINRIAISHSHSRDWDTTRTLYTQNYSLYVFLGFSTIIISRLHKIYLREKDNHAFSPCSQTFWHKCHVFNCNDKH